MSDGPYLSQLSGRRDEVRQLIRHAINRNRTSSINKLAGQLEVPYHWLHRRIGLSGRPAAELDIMLVAHLAELLGIDWGEIVAVISGDSKAVQALCSDNMRDEVRSIVQEQMSEMRGKLKAEILQDIRRAIR